jgi:Raf kinase inhibitor-like YbhB/YbcL family protein
MRRAFAILVAFAGLIAAGCGGGSKPATSSSPSAGTGSIHIASGFGPGAAIPRVYTCDGRDVSPPVRAVGLPAATREVVVVMRDPDAPGGNFIHWDVAGLDPANGSVILGVAARPSGAVLGRNSFGSLGYRGPCPPAGPAHHYELTVYALGQPSGLQDGFSAGDVAALPILGQGTLTGTYARAK